MHCCLMETALSCRRPGSSAKRKKDAYRAMRPVVSDIKISILATELGVIDREKITRIFLIFTENVHYYLLFPGQLSLCGISQSRRRYMLHLFVLYINK